MKSREHKNSYYLREHGRRENLSFLLQKRSFLPMLQKTSFLFFLLRKAFFAFLERQSSFASWESKLSFVFCESFLPLFKREACSFSSTINFHVFSQKRSFHCFSKDKLSFFPSQRIAFQATLQDKTFNPKPSKESSRTKQSKELIFPCCLQGAQTLERCMDAAPCIIEGSMAAARFILE